MKIAIQGVAGSFHDQAVRQFYNINDYELIACNTFEDVFKSVKNGTTEVGFVAIENSLYGSIHETYDMIIKYRANIVGEIQLPIHQQLIVLPNADLADIHTVMSHPAALDQCRSYIEKHLPNAKIIEHHDTAGAVYDISQGSDSTVAAIASEAAATLYGMKVLAKNIEDEPDNITRFIVISKKPLNDKSSNKASLILLTDHTPGSLYRALGVFNKHNVNLTKIESRHVRGQPYKYQFIVDAICSSDQLSQIMLELSKQNCIVTELGHYLENLNP